MHIRFRILALALSAALGCTAQPASRTGTGGDARSIELGTSTAELLSLLGAPNRTRDATKGDRSFRTFYYANDLNCVVDPTTDVVCKVSVGVTDGYRYPLR
jgi:hypothetical protein